MSIRSALAVNRLARFGTLRSVPVRFEKRTKPLQILVWHAWHGSTVPWPVARGRRRPGTPWDALGRHLGRLNMQKNQCLSGLGRRDGSHGGTVPSFCQPSFCQILSFPSSHLLPIIFLPIRSFPHLFATHLFATSPLFVNLLTFVNPHC